MTHYPLSLRAAPDLERTRLRLLDEYHDPLSADQLDAIGVGEGWRCLDVGAGAGSVTRMLAERVGTTGSVLSVDLDTTLLEELASDRVEVRRQDLMSDQLPRDSFDLINARLVLMFLSPRLGALQRLASAARPGAWLALIEPDFTTVGVSPTSSLWQRIWSQFFDAAMAGGNAAMAGGWDPGYGARLFSDLHAAELVDVHAEYVTRRHPGGSPSSRLLSLTVERLKEPMVLLGADRDEIEAARRLLDEPTRTITLPMTCVARGRRPGRS